MRCRVVTPPTVGSMNGLMSSDRVPGVQTVSLSTSRTTSPQLRSTPSLTALRLPAIGVQHPFEVAAELLAHRLEHRVALAVDDDDDLGRALRDDAVQDVPEQVDRLVHDRDHDAGRRLVRLGPRPVAPRQRRP